MTGKFMRRLSIVGLVWLVILFPSRSMSAEKISNNELFVRSLSASLTSLVKYQQELGQISRGINRLAKSAKYSSEMLYSATLVLGSIEKTSKVISTYQDAIFYITLMTDTNNLESGLQYFKHSCRENIKDIDREMKLIDLESSAHDLPKEIAINGGSAKVIMKLVSDEIAKCARE
jgi:hypothetical protein